MTEAEMNEFIQERMAAGKDHDTIVDELVLEMQRGELTSEQEVICRALAGIPEEVFSQIVADCGLDDVLLSEAEVLRRWEAMKQ